MSEKDPEKQSSPNKIMTLHAAALYKILSGRFILTIVGAACFLIVTKTICDILVTKIGDLKISDIVLILTNILLILSNIFTFYFVKNTLHQKPPVPEAGENNGNTEEDQ